MKKCHLMQTETKEGKNTLSEVLDAERQEQMPADKKIDFERLERLFVEFEKNPNVIFDIEKVLKELYLSDKLPSFFLRNVRISKKIMDYVTEFDLGTLDWSQGDNEGCRILSSCLMTLTITLSEMHKDHCEMAEATPGFYERMVELAQGGHKDIACRSLGALGCLLSDVSVFGRLMELNLYDTVIPEVVGRGDAEVTSAAATIVGNSYPWMDCDDETLELFLRLVKLFLDTRLVSACNPVIYGLSNMIGNSRRSVTVIEAAYQTGILAECMSLFEKPELVPAAIMLFDRVVNEESCEIGMRLLSEGLFSALYVPLQDPSLEANEFVVGLLAKCASRDPAFLHAAVQHGVIRQLHEIVQSSGFDNMNKAAMTVADWFCVQHDRRIVLGMIADGGLDILTDFLPYGTRRTTIKIIHALNHIIANHEELLPVIASSCQSALEEIAYETVDEGDATRELIAAAQDLLSDIEERVH